MRFIEEELAGFSPDDQERLSGDFVAYLRRLQTIRAELNKGENDVKEGRVSGLADLDSAIEALRSEYAGA